MEITRKRGDTLKFFNNLRIRSRLTHARIGTSASKPLKHFNPEWSSSETTDAEPYPGLTTTWSEDGKKLTVTLDGKPYEEIFSWTEDKGEFSATLDGLRHGIQYLKKRPQDTQERTPRP